MKKNLQQVNASVVLAVDCSSYSSTSIALAVEMAAKINTQLQALIIEDEDLVRVAGLPFSQEISRSTAQQSPTSEQQMLRSLRSMASQFRKSLQQVAQASGIHWNIKNVSGKVVEVCFRDDMPSTFTVVCQSRTYHSPAIRSRRNRKVLLLQNQSPNLQQAVEIVLRNFSPDKVEITLLSDSSNPDLEMELQHADATAHRLSIVKTSPQQLEEQLSRSASFFDCAIISRHADIDLQRQVIRNLHCPLILVS